MPLLCSQTEGSRGDDDDARSTTSSSSRKSSGGRQQATRAATVRQSRAGKPGSRVATMGDYIEQALEEQRRKAERKAVTAAARTSRSERRASGEGLLPPVNEQQPSLQREASMASEAASGSPMSVTMEPPASDGSTRLPAAQAASVDRMASDYDSSDEEGAHKPPSPAPEPPPAQQPLPPPPMQLAAQAHCLAAKLPAVTTPVTGEQQSRTRPRTTRVSDAKSRGRRQSFIEFAEREKERREKQADRTQSTRCLYAAASNVRRDSACAMGSELALHVPSQWDEGSKRKKAWCVNTLVGGRAQGDGSIRSALWVRPKFARFVKIAPRRDAISERVDSGASG